MGFLDVFKYKEYKKELESLKSIITPEMNDVVKATETLKFLKSEIEQLNVEKNKSKNEINDLSRKISQQKSLLIETEDKVLLQEFGLYEPKYDFSNSEIYKKKLEKIRQQQKEMIKNGVAATGNMNWTVNGNASQGKKMVKDMQKLLLRAFNSECDELVNKVKYNNFETSQKRIFASRNAISKLGKIMDVSVSDPYYNSKIKELTLAFEYAQKKQEEKEQQKALREQLREEAKMQKEIEEERKKIEKEQNHYKNALSSIIKQIETSSEEERADLLAKKQELEEKLNDANTAMQKVDYRAANQRAGYVYIISNIGSFGENVYKIGMTRRLYPQDRVDELGDASVPFNFDVHAMIFSDDAPALETALHKAFENKKLNMVNQRREFFKVTLDEIKSVVKSNYDKTVEFTEFAEAEQFRVSEKMRQSK